MFRLIKTKFTFNCLNISLILSMLFLQACGGGAGDSLVDDFLGDSLGDQSRAVTYSATNFNESINDGGVIDDIITISVQNAVFSGANGENFLSSGKVAISNIPNGLTARVIRNGATSLTFSFTGAAVANTSSDDVNNISINFNDSAFVEGSAGAITGASQSGISITYNVLQVIYSSSTFNENLANDGSISETITITLQGDTFTGTNGSDFVAATKITSSNVPAGLTLSATKTSNNTVAVTLTGNASTHTDLQDLANFNLSFQDSAFNINSASNIDFTTRTDLRIDFINPAQLSYDTKTFLESAANNGTIGNTVTITLTNDVYSGSNGDNFIADGKATVSNTPAGLTATLTRSSNTELLLNLTGTAGSHLDSDDISNLSVIFNATAFTFGNNIALVENFNTNDIIVDFNDPVSLSYSGATFNESITNVGTISNTLTITLANDTFAGTNGENLISTSKASISNLPAGSVGVLTLTSPTTAILSLLGNATSHDTTNDIANLTLNFAGTAFTNSSDPSQIVNSNRNDIVVDFIAPYTLSYSTKTIQEAPANNGSVVATSTITLTGTTFNAAGGENLIGTGKVIATNTPSGLAATVTVVNATSATLAFTGTASPHINTNDISNFTLSFIDSAFVSGESDGVTSALTNDIAIDFNDPASLAYSASTFTEADTNIGNIGTTVTVTLTNDTFTGSNSDNFVADGKISVSNVPTGLTAVATRTSPTTIDITLSGTAPSNANSNSISNLGITFQDSAFSNVLASTVTNFNQSSVNVNFLDPYTLNYSTAALNEDGANDGSISQTITLNLIGTTFTGSDGDNYVSAGKLVVTNLPAGLTISAIKQNNTQLIVSFGANASSNANADSISNLTLSFNDSAFASNENLGVTDSIKNDISITFDDPPSVSYLATSFSESVSNIGATATAVNLVLANKTFDASVSDDLIAAGKATFSNVPAGLTPVITVTSPTLATLTFTGNASAHASTDDVSNMTITFLDAAFTGGNAVGVTNNVFNTLSLAFIDPYTLSYSATTLDESSSNDGQISTSLTLTLIGTTFNGSNGDNFIADSKLVVTNLPTGLLAVANKNSSSSMTLTFTGSATSNLNSDDVSNLTFTFQDTAFTSGAAAGVTDAVKADFIVDFRDPASLAYSATVLNEAVANVGTITEILTITLTNDTFTGSNGDNLVANGKALVTNIPSGMVATLTETSSTTVDLALTSSASAHANAADISNLSVSFLASAFTFNSNSSTVTDAARTDLSVNFLDPYSIAYSATTFSESAANDGSIGNTSTLTLSGTTLAGNNSDDFIADGKANISNLSTGLTATLVRQDTTTLLLTISGNATNNLNSHDVSNLTIDLLNTAFTSGNAAGVSGASNSTLVLDFNDAPTLAYSGTTFNELNTNVGRIDNSITVTLADDTFSGSNGEDFVANSKISVSNLPSGLTAQAQRTSATTVVISLLSVASAHDLANNISNLIFTFEDSAFTNVAASNISGSTNSGLSVSYLAPYTIVYSTSTLSEAIGNDGSITGNIILTLSGTTFSGSNSDDFVGDTKVAVSNIPTGLTAVLNRNSATELALSFTGNATNHADINDVSNVTVTFNDSAFTVGESDGVSGRNRSDLSLNFKNADTLIYSGSNFNESLANDGSTTTTLTVTLSGDTFTGSDSDNFIADGKITPANVPAGLTAVATRVNSTTIDFTLTNNASVHADVNDISNVTFTFQNTAFTNNTSATNVTNYNKSDISVDYNDPSTLSYSTASFSEAVANDGSISNSITITVSGDTFTGSNSDDFVTDTKVAVTNVPAGLMGVVTRSSDTTLTFTLSGNASVHAASDNVSSITLVFANTAFTNNSTASNVTGFTKSDFSIDFDAPASLSYGTSTFAESLANNGSISTIINIDLFSDTLTGSNSDDFVSDGKITVGNLPAGLTAVASRASDNQLNVALTGNATVHANSNDVSNLTFTFENTAFTANATASNVTNYAKSDLVVNYDDPATLSYSGSSFSEALTNDGSITTSVNIDISGDTFSGSNGENFVSASKISFANVPTGLTAQVLKVSSTQLALTFTGNASTHAVANNVSNVEITFANTAFTNNSTAANITNYTRADLSILYNDPSTLTYSNGTFNESLANDGSFSSSINIDISGDTFSGSNSDDFVAGGKIFVANIPSGLTAVATRTSTTRLSLTLSGNAGTHIDSSDISDLTLTFQNNAFTNNALASNVTNYDKSDIEVNFNDPAILSFGSTSFSESVNNDGSISDTVLITLSGDTFTGSVSDDFVASSKVSITNIPTGLTAVATKSSTDTLTISFTGNASIHSSSDTIANLTVTFNDSAFTNNSSASNVTNFAKSDLSVVFTDPPTLSYGSSTFAEALSNDGSISNSLSVTLISDTFSGNNGDNFIADGKIVATNVPTGLTAVALRDDSNNLTITLTGTAGVHANTDDISNLTLTFQNSAFTNTTNATNVLGFGKNDIEVNFNDPASIIYGGTSLSEALSNNGSFTSTFTIDLSGDTFSGSNSDNFIADSKVTATNVPTGLQTVVTRTSSTQLTVSLTGNATAHANAQDVANFTLTFQDSAFTNNAAAINVTNYLKNDLNIDFLDPALLSYSSTTFSESVANDGSITGTITLTLAGDTLTGTNGENYISASKLVAGNVPTGLLLTAVKASSTTITVGLSGNSTTHALANSISNLTITLQNSAFTNNTTASNVTNYLKSDLAINFNDPATLSYSSASLSESLANDGSITGSLTLTISGDTFTGSNTDNFIADGKIVVSNEPAGLDFVATRASATELTVTVTGNASSHLSSDNLSNIGFTFQNTAFTNNTTASNVTNYNKSDLSLSFNDPASISYSGATFNEATSNTGSISGSIALTLSGDTFTGSNSDNFISASKASVSNTPTGLVAVLTKTSDTILTLTLTGSASAHANAQDISNLTVTLNDSAFTNNGSAINVTGYTKNDISINFNDPATLAYSTATLVESIANDGSIAGSITITLSGDTFTGSNSDDFVSDTKISVGNLPTGLVASIVRSGPTTLTATLSSNASSHINSDDISNLTFTFNASAFTDNTDATNVTNYNKNDITVDFADPATLAYSGSLFIESATNNGSSATTLTITLSGDTFTGSNSDDFVADSKISSVGLPAGLDLVATRTSDTTVVLSVTGNATSHTTADNISNLQVIFANTAVTNNVAAANITNYNKSDLGFSFNDPATLSYGAANFSEALANDGSITDTIDITLSGDTFSGSNSDNFISDGKIVTGNVPLGLIAVATRISSTVMRLSFTGTATSNSALDDISNLTYTFQDTAFTSNANAMNVTNYDRSDLAINYNDPASLAYSASSLSESLANNGSFSGTFNIDITGDTFSGSNSDEFVGASKIVVGNLPGGLGLTATRVTNTRLLIAITGNAAVHTNSDDITNLTLTFANTAFTNNATSSNVTNYNRSDILLDFIDPASIAFSDSTFNEADANDGSIDNTITLTLTGDTFSGSNSDDFIAASKITIGNVPAGLVETVTRTSDTELLFSLTTNATTHLDAQDISNLTVTLADSAFANNAAAINVVNYTRTDLNVNFNNPATLSYNSSGFGEDSGNSGSFSGSSIVVNLLGDTFTGSNSDDFISDSKIAVTNLPGGLAVVATKDSDTQLTFTLTGSATLHANAQDITNLTFTFANSAFTSTVNAADVSNSAKADIVVDFDDPASIAYSNSTFNESVANDGSISNSINLTLTSDTFTGSNSDNFIVDGKASVTNLPAGLLATLVRASDTLVTLTLTGTASAHADLNDISNLTVTFLNGAFNNNATASNVSNYAKNDLAINFENPATLAYSGAAFNESLSNDGSISTTLTITLTGDTFTGTNGENFVTSTKVTPANVPTNLSLVVSRTSDTTVDITLSGNANDHADLDDISNLTLTFANSAFTNNTVASNVVNYQRADLAINFTDPATLAYSASTFVEALSNDGIISTTITVTVAGDTFTGSNSDDFITDTKVSVANLPTGLDAVATRTSSSTIDLTLTGSASAHSNAQDIANLTFTFQNSAFTNNTLASNVINFGRADIAIDFSDPASLNYGSTTFAEASSNNGSFGGSSIVVTLVGDTFTGSNSDNFVATSKVTPTNLPANLTLVATRDSATQITFTVTGNATAHADANDISNLTFTFADSAFTNNSAASNITNYNKNDFIVNFLAPASIGYASSNFSESATNDGSFAGSVISLTLTGDTFTGSNSDNFITASKIIPTNVPAGLLAVATRTSDTTIDITLTGNATTHTAAQNVADITFTFANTAFTNNTSALNITNYNKSDITATFTDPASLSYSSAVFNEALSNDGSFTGATITVTLAGDTFTGSNSDNFVGSAKVVATNVPTNLTAVATRTSDTTINFTLTSNATNHTDANDISNLTFTFADSAFTNNSLANNVTNFAKNDINVNFNDPAVLAYSGSTFTEAVINDGSTTTSITITITGDTFTGGNGSNYISDTKIVPSNLPSGMGASVVKDSDTQLTFTLTGSASPHANAQDVSNVSLTFLPSAFTGNTVATNVTNNQKNDFIVDFNDPYVLTYSTDTFNENTPDDGTMLNSIIITLTGTTFTGADSSDFITDTKATVTNVPSGLSATLVKDNNAQLTLSLTGTADDPDPADSISNLTITFANSAFTINDASLVAANSKNDINVTYFATPVLSPTGFTISNTTATSVTLGWNDIATNNTFYTIETCTGSGCSSTFTTAATTSAVSGTAVSHTITGLTEGNYYRFRIRAANGSTESAWVEGDTTILFGGITSVDNGAGTSDEFKNMNCLTSKGTYITLFWPAVTGATSYDIYDETSGSTLVTTVDGAETSVLITGLEIATAYSYKVVVNVPGGITSQNATTTDITSSADFVPCLAIGGGGNEASTGLNDFDIPKGAFIYGTKLFIVDTNNHRVLIYNTLPTSSTDTPDVVVGQKFIDDLAGTDIGITRYMNYDGEVGDDLSETAANALYYPSGVWAGMVGGSEKMVIADRANHRVLIWNGIPTTSHSSADLVVGQSGMNNRQANVPNRDFGLNNPRGVFSDGTRLFIADSSNSRVNIYNTFPTSNGAGPDVCLGNTSCSAANNGRTANDMNNPFTMIVESGKLFVADYNNNRVLVWNTIPTSDTQNADVVIGQSTMTAGTASAGAANMNRPTGITYDNTSGKLFITDTINSRIKVYNSIPTINGVSSDYVLGRGNTFNSGGLQASRFNRVEGPIAISGTAIYATDTNNSRIKVYNTIPTVDDTDADFHLGHQGTRYTASNQGGAKSGLTFRPVGVAYDTANTQLFVTDDTGDRVLVWDDPPTSESDAPDFVLGQADFTSDGGARTQTRLNRPRGLCIGGGKLWVNDYNNRRVMVWDLPITMINQPADYVLGQTSFTNAANITGKSGVTNPSGCFYDETNDRFFVTDINRDKVLMWDGLPAMTTEADNPAADFVIGVEASIGLNQTDIRDPTTVTSDGTYIYVAGYGRRRIMAYPIPTTDNPNAAFVLGQPNFVTEDNSVSQSITRRPRAILYTGGKLIYSDQEANRIAWWENPGTSAASFQSMTGLYGKKGTDWNDTQETFYSPLDTLIYEMATDGKRLFIGDYNNSKLIIVPIK